MLAGHEIFSPHLIRGFSFIVHKIVIRMQTRTYLNFIKRPVFAGYHITSHDADILTIDVLLSSPSLDPDTSKKDEEEYTYLQQLAESISRSELCTSIKVSALI